MSSNQIRTGQSSEIDARLAVAEFHAAVVQPEMDLVFFFCSSKYNLDVLAAEMNRLFAGVQVVGCTSAGEIGTAGYLQHSLSGASFAARSCTAVSGMLGDLKQFEIAQGHSFAQNLLQQLEVKVPHAGEENCFAFMLVDGLSKREESVSHALQYALGNIPLVGGSAGDDLQFAKTYVFSEGRFKTDAVVLILVHTDLPFLPFKTQHFVSTDERLVVTEADPDMRLVKEINGLPAAAEYARLVGVAVEDLNPMRFAASPVVVLINGLDYVRSIQRANPDGSLTFFCAIEDGVVFRVAIGVDLKENLRQTFDLIRQQVGQPQLVLACDCVLRNVEVVQSGIKKTVADILCSNNTIGFSSYGEQYRGIHVNQTFLGIAIGTRGGAA